MSYFDKLDTDIWINILELLAHQDVPIPLSGWVKEETFKDSEVRMMNLPSVGDPGVTTRSDIRVPELAALMSTSIAVNQLAAIPLYRRVITDSIKALSINYRKPRAHSAIASKQDLLGHTRHLHLEFRQKGAQPKYRELMEEGKYWRIIGGEGRETDTISIEAGIEADHIVNAFNLLSPTSKSPETAFPSLNYLSLASIFGAQARMWDNALSVWHSGEAQMTCDKMGRTLAGSPIIDLCSRGSSTPYSLPSIIDWPQKSSTTSTWRTVHHFEFFDKFIPASIAHETRWIMENHERLTNLDPSEVARMVEDALLDVIDQRKGYRGYKDQRFQLEVHASTGLAQRQIPKEEVGTYWGKRIIMSGDGERAKTKESYEEAKRAMKEEGWPQQKGDTFQWKALIDAPPCLACGWKYQD